MGPTGPTGNVSVNILLFGLIQIKANDNIRCFDYHIGLAGANGANGAAGPVGATGATGQPGVAGVAGVTGAAGAAGVPGAKVFHHFEEEQNLNQ
jgi:hypothetical protein